MMTSVRVDCMSSATVAGNPSGVIAVS